MGNYEVEECIETARTTKKFGAYVAAIKACRKQIDAAMENLNMGIYSRDDAEKVVSSRYMDIVDLFEGAGLLKEPKGADLLLDRLSRERQELFEQILERD
ncbi:MAG TPA: hypothetical protein ENN30_01905 [Candidatus Woesearchaeota archaeon]|nr:hypothetical protein [Candidatus Woesearchaeota archaeon]